MRPMAVWSVRLRILCNGVLLVASACNSPAPRPSPTAPSPKRLETEASTPAATAWQSTVEDPPEPITIDIDPPERDRWLTVLRARDDSEGAWATGSFDPKRNRLTIRMRDVQRFIIDTSRIPIDWERVVILSINNRNTELRKRDYPVLHFVRDEHAQWVVADP